MAYVKTRTTGAGSVSTALVEAYRDESGRPRQRLLANLHGEPDTLSALAKLAARRDALRKEKDALTADAAEANRFYEVVTTNTLQGRQYSASERKEIDTLLRQRDRLVARLAKIETDLATIQRDGIAIKKHCSATPDKIQAAIKAYKQKLDDADAQAVGGEYMLKEAKAKLRRLQAIR
jgi:chromosome segregation ATPase